MPKTRVFTKTRTDWLILRPNSDGSFSIEGHFWLVDEEGEQVSLPWSGNDGVSGAIVAAAETAIGNYLKAKAAHLIQVKDATHDLVLTDGEYVETLKR